MKVSRSALIAVVCFVASVAHAQTPNPATTFAPAGQTPAPVQTPVQAPSRISYSPAVSSLNPSAAAAVNAAVNPTLTPIMYQGVDIAPLVEDAKSYIVTTTKEFRTYHWSARNYMPRWKNAPLGHEPSIIADAKMYGDIYWKTAGPGNNTGSMYGNGLYVAADPVATFSYSGSNDHWEVMEFKVPVGLHLIDIARPHGSQITSALRSSIESKFNCSYYYGTSPGTAFSSGGSSLNQTCFDLVKHIYKDILKVDGLIYGYSTQSFMSCQNRATNIDFAIVFFDGDWMNDKNVQYYIRFSRNNLEERRIIQTLFMGEQQAHTAVDQAAVPAVTRLLTANPSFHIMPASAHCSSYSCLMEIKACDATETNCTSVTINLPLPFSPVFNKLSSSTYEPSAFLWEDLAGQLKATRAQTEAWLKKNRLGCDGTEFLTATYTPKGMP